ncbi:MAG: desulfoferrodoxin family protein [Eubacteriales bacterium]|nr:desulfoferrodoxin family protein [Eubacteriales bacterium]MDD4583335.1 desulfoferrodoxin family protein [Eubacteriales bacterium]
MCEKPRFFICKHCGNIIGMIKSSGVPVVCCGEPMTELVGNTVEASYEKHIPVIQVEDDKVNVIVGSVIHPMTEEHNISWIYLQTTLGGQRKCLEVGKEPKVCFKLCKGEAPIAAYAYCNLHGLWKSDVE